MKRPRPYWHASKARGRFCQTPEKDKEKCGDGLEIFDFFSLSLVQHHFWDNGNTFFTAHQNRTTGWTIKRGTEYFTTSHLNSLV